MKKLLNIITTVSVTTFLLTACMADSISFIPVAVVCAGSVAVMTAACVIRERL